MTICFKQFSLKQVVQKNNSMWFDNEKQRKLVWKHQVDGSPIYMGMAFHSHIDHSIFGFSFPSGLSR